MNTLDSPENKAMLAALKAEGLDPEAKMQAVTKSYVLTDADAELLAAFNKARPKLYETIKETKEVLNLGGDQETVRKLLLQAVQKAEVRHDYNRNNKGVERQDNSAASRQMLKCLILNDEPEMVLRCTYGLVFAIIDNLAEAEAVANVEEDEPVSDLIPEDDSLADEVVVADKIELFDPPADVPDPNIEPLDLFGGSQDSADEADVPKDETFDQLEGYLAWLASEISSLVDVVEIEDVEVIVPAVDTVTLRQARSNGNWVLFYSSVMGDEDNPNGKSFSQLVADQQKAANTSAKDVAAMTELIKESVERYEDGTPKRTYRLMTLEAKAELKGDIATLLGLPPESKLLEWLWRELVKGAGPDALRQLYADKQQEWADKDQARSARRQQAKEHSSVNLRSRRPKSVVRPKPTPSTKAAKLAKLGELVAAEIDGKTDEEVIDDLDGIVARVMSV